MERHGAPANDPTKADEAEHRAEIQRRVEAEEELNKLADPAAGDSTFKSTAIFIVGAVVLAVIVAVLYATLA